MTIQLISRCTVVHFEIGFANNWYLAHRLANGSNLPPSIPSKLHAN